MAAGIVAGIDVPALIFVIVQVPETRARSLEDLGEDVSTGAIHQVARSADAHQFRSPQLDPSKPWGTSE